jgi:hypothetical protein
LPPSPPNSSHGTLQTVLPLYHTLILSPGLDCAIVYLVVFVCEQLYAFTQRKCIEYWAPWRTDNNPWHFRQLQHHSLACSLGPLPLGSCGSKIPYVPLVLWIRQSTWTLEFLFMELFYCLELLCGIFFYWSYFFGVFLEIQ